jgi:pyruvate/2-oxoglutarate dehydrogenase complex dihydrolipoamide acyltransferase (E2) component
VNATGAVRAEVPADGERPRRPVSHSGPLAGGTAVNEALARLLAALEAEMPRDEVEAVYAFPPVRREGQEHGVAVVSRVAGGGRRRVYRARYVVVLKGPERGTVTVSVEETAEAPAALLPEVLEGVRRRADEAGEAEPVDLTAWKAGEGERSGSA